VCVDKYEAQVCLKRASFLCEEDYICFLLWINMLSKIFSNSNQDEFLLLKFNVTFEVELADFLFKASIISLSILSNPFSQALMWWQLFYVCMCGCVNVNESERERGSSPRTLHASCIFPASVFCGR